MKVNKYNKCSGGGGTTCNLEDKSVTPSMGERNNDGYIVVEEGEGYDGLSRVVIDPQTIYNEGVNEQKSKLVSISITENGTYNKEDGYNHIEVNVKPKINIKEAGVKFRNSTFVEVPEWADFDGVTDMKLMFSECSNLQTIPLLNTSNVTNMERMFISCSNLQTIPLIDTSNVTNMSYMFSGCRNLQTIPPLNTSNVTDMNSMFYEFSGNKALASLPKFNCQKVKYISDYFSYYSDGMSALTDVGGWENLKCDWKDNKGLAACPNLTYQSCINILNGLYDFVGNGSTETRTLKVHPNFLTTVGDEISIGTAKGWSITA